MKKAELEAHQAAFIAAVEPVLLEVGAVRAEGKMYPWTLETKAGTLSLSPSVSLTEQGGAVNCRFEDVGRACEFLGVPKGGPPAPGIPLNPYSGKWNQTMYGWPPDAVVRNLRHALRSIL